jgi:hypothetical protein
MKTIDIYYQGDGIWSLEHIEVIPDETFAALQALIAKKHSLVGEVLLFLEDEIEPADPRAKIGDKAGRAGIKAHVHRCRQIQVVVHFKDKSIHGEFAPGTMIARVKHWAAVRKLGMTEEEASDHHLQLARTTDQPDPGTHIGTLATCPKCKVEFDLVTTPKVNGCGGRA